MRKPKTAVVTRQKQYQTADGSPVINLTGGAIEREIVSLYDHRAALLSQVWEMEDQIVRQFRKLAHLGPNDGRIRFQSTKEGRLEIPSYDTSRLAATEYLLEARANIDPQRKFIPDRIQG